MGVVRTSRQEQLPPQGEQSPAQQGQGGVGGPRSAWLLTVCCVAQFMVILDLSIVNVALPSIQSSLNFSAIDLQWVVDGYAIAFAGFLMLGGRAADHFGQRRTFVLALLLFAIASLAGGVAQSREMLIAARIGQGLSGALMAASSLAIITSSFPPGPQLHRAIGIWAAMNGAGGAAGTLFGGVLTQELSWRWVLLINPPIGVAAAVVGWAVVADRRRERGAGSFDLPGALTLTIGQMVLVYGIVTAGARGWNAAAALIPIAIGLALLALFAVIEARLVSAPLVPFRELTRPLRIANLIVLLFSAALFPMWYVSSLYLQQVLGLSPLTAGLTFLPMALMIMVCARRAGPLVSRFGVRAVLGGGLILMTAGMLLFARVAASGSAVAYIVIPGLLTAAGIGFSIVPSTIAATQGAKQGQAGLASGLVNTSRQIGGGLGIALLITLATEYTSHLIGAGHGAPHALTEGFRLAYLIGAGFVAAAAVVTFAFVPTAADSTRTRQLRLVAGLAVAIVVFVAASFIGTSFKPAPIGAYTTKQTYHFVSAPTLHPPLIEANQQPAAARLAPGYILTANFYDVTVHPMVGQSGPLMLSNQLQPVWFQPVPENVVASNLSRQTYEGKPVLAWWQGVVTDTGATTSGEDLIVNQHYQTVARLRGTGGWILTLHAIVIRGSDAFVTANKNVPRDLSRYGGAYNGALIDSAIQEYDLRTGKLIRSWDALRHIPLSDSYAIPPINGFPWDAYHVNAIDVTSGGNKALVSMRNTWAAYMIDLRTGKVEWNLGGKHSSFKLGPGAAFQWQHDVELGPDSTVTMFDDHCCEISGAGTFLPASGPSRALVLRLDQGARTARLVAQYTLGEHFDADYMGDTQTLPGGNVFVGWGSQPEFSEYSRSGQLLLDAVFPHPDLSYRTNLEPWTGQPLYPPSGAARRHGSSTTVYASWNGATRVASWKVFARTGGGSMALVAWYDKGGFETAVPVPRGYTTFKLEALDASRRVIGVSRPFTTGA